MHSTIVRTTKLTLALLACLVGLLAAGSSVAQAANGCGPERFGGAVPDSFFGADFTAACNAHDDCYAASSRTARATCDANLRSAMRASCARTFDPGTRLSACNGVTTTYYEAVRRLGENFYSGSGDPS